MENEIFWKAKVAGFIHDPPEKALILFRRAHEGGTVKELIGVLEIDEGISRIAREADRLAASVDRIDLSKTNFDARTDFLKNPEIIHPLSCERYDLKSLWEWGEDQKLQTVEDSFSVFYDKLVHEEDDKIWYKKTFLKFWRFGQRPWDHKDFSKYQNLSKFGKLIGVLPADTRCPDHSIFDHLRMTSVLSGIKALNDKPALLKFSIGPVQSFIEQARKASDMWAGSHLLSTLCFEAIKLIVDKYGPDSIIYPSLLGLPVVDLYLVEKLGGCDFSKDVEWLKRESDSNPLFRATIPNLFVAILPYDQVQKDKDIDNIKKVLIEMLKDWCIKAVKLLFNIEGYIQKQIKEQVSNFLDIHYVLVPFSDNTIRDQLDNWFGIGSSNWQESNFYAPSYHYSDRLLSAVKSVRQFEQLTQEGYRCTICGEREWLTNDEKLLTIHGNQGVWESVQQEKPAYAKEGERLCAICTLKRMWQDVYKNELQQKFSKLGLNKNFQTFNVSTQAIALAPTIHHLQQCDDAITEIYEFITSARERDTAVKDTAQCALPPLLLERADTKPDPELREKLLFVSKCLPTLLESDSSSSNVERIIKEYLGYRHETYYAIILMDGDNMGGWVSGEFRRPYRESLHYLLRNQPEIIEELENTQRELTPFYHSALSDALNSFSLNVAPRIVERVFKGKIIYSGGDDLMAFVSIDDLVDCMLLLRLAYSGINIPRASMTIFNSQIAEWFDRHRDSMQNFNSIVDLSQRTHIQLGNGYARSQESLWRMLGRDATMSMGAVVAHHTTPLSMVLKNLRQAEKQAKALPGKNGFCIRIIKRSGGAETFCANWWYQTQVDERENIDLIHSPIVSLLRLIRLMASPWGENINNGRPGLGKPLISRRFVYNFIEYLHNVPTNSIQNLLSYQLIRQLNKGIPRNNKGCFAQELKEIAGDIVQTFSRNNIENLNDVLRSLVIVAEFLSRQGREQ